MVQLSLPRMGERRAVRLPTWQQLSSEDPRRVRAMEEMLAG